jgi:methyl coenzyme M reductase subunit D
MTERKTTVMDLMKMNDDDSDEIDPQLIGSLMYMVNTRPDSCYAVNMLSQPMS